MTQKTDNEIIKAISPARIAEWEKWGLDAIEADLKNTGGIRYVGGSQENRMQAWAWVRVQRRNENLKHAEAVNLKPGLWGISIDLKVSWRKACDWFKQKFQR